MRLVLHVLGLIAAAVIALAGAGKLLDAPQFLLTLRASPLVPHGLEGPLSILIPAGELLLGLSVLVGLARVRCAVALLAMVVVLSVAAAVFPPPKGGCGCFGVASSMVPWFESSVGLHLRNAAIIAGLACGLSAWRVDSPASLSAPRPVSSRTPPAAPAHAGFTIIEVLVVILIVGLVVMLALPVLGRAQRESRERVSLANLRSHAQIVAAYLGDSAGAFPHFTKPGEEVTLVASGASVRVQARYFDAAQLWFVALADSYYDGNATSESFIAPRDRARAGPGRMAYSSYWYSCAFLADPEYYTWGRRRPGFEQLRGTRASQVVDPQRKSLFAEYRFATDESVQPPLVLPIDPANASFVDGHAESVGAARWLQQDDDGDYQLRLNEHTATHVMPLTHTLGGARGRDLK